ncbi:MAG: GAF domain-containing protein [Anaerolineae bacterium]|jgi:PAS domain S-box-containing protein
MPWATLIDGVLWAVSLAVSISLARLVYRRRELPAKLYFFVVLALIVPQLYHLGSSLIIVLAALLPLSWDPNALVAMQTATPLDIAAMVISAALILHLVLVFPKESRLAGTWRWALVALYIPAVVLAVVTLSQLILVPEDFAAFWGTNSLRARDPTPQAAFAVFVLGLAMLRLLLLLMSRPAAAVRRQVTWLMFGLGVAGGIAFLGSALPVLLGASSQAIIVPGWKQLSILALLGAFGLAIYRYDIFDVVAIANRIVVYGIFMVSITLLYLALATLLGHLLRNLAPGLALTLVAILTTLLVVLIAQPLRDAIQDLVDGAFHRYQMDHQQLLRDYSRELAMLTDVPHLLDRIAGQIVAALHPMGLAIVLARQDAGFRVALSRGTAQSHPLWQEANRFEPDALVLSQLAKRTEPLYLPWHAHELAERQRSQWERLGSTGVHVLVPMHLREALVGWFALWPKASDLAYTGRDLQFLSDLADHSCMALENARLFGEMQQRVAELATVSMVSSAISSSLDLEQVLETIVESVIQVVGCDKSAIFVLGDSGQELSLRMSRGLSQAYVEGSRRLSVGLDNRTMAVATGRLLVSPDIYSDPRLADLVPVAVQEGYRAVIDVPLDGREGPLGVLSVYFADIHQPSELELEVLTTFANHASIAIENARLYASVAGERDQTRLLYEQTDAALARRLAELTSIEEISRQLTQVLDVRRVMTVVLERALQATRAPRGIIALHDLDRSRLRLVAQVGYPAELNRYESEPWPLSRGITGRVARTGESSLIADVSQDPDYWQVLPTTRSQMTVPIHHERGVLGVISLEGEARGFFTRENLRFVQLLAEHAAIGIHNAQLFQQVRDARDQLQAVLDSTHDAVIVLDRDGRVVLTNPRTSEMLGGEAKEWLEATTFLEPSSLDESVVLRTMELDAQRLKSMIRQVCDSPQETVGIDFSFKREGVLKYVEGTTSPMVSASGAVLGHVAVLRDVTHQRELEQFRDDLTSMVIHNLQGPLAAILSSLEMLQEGSAHDPDTDRELVRIALTSGRDLQERIESLLWIRRLEEKQVPLDLDLLPLPDLIQPVSDEYLSLAQSAGVRLHVHVPSDLIVDVDPEIVKRVFANLIENAIKFTAAGGEISIEAGLVPDGQFVLCSVADTGSGIPKGLQQTIFEKFRRGDPAQNQRRRGMGIGLHYCKLAMEAHGGQIWVESEEGQGSTFFLTLPTAAANQGRAP